MTSGSSFDNIVQLLSDCMDAALARMQARADLTLSQVERGSLQIEPARSVVTAARARAMAEVDDCTTAATTSLTTEAAARKASLAATETQARDEIDADAQAARKAVDSLVAAGRNNVEAITGRIAKQLKFKEGAAWWSKGAGAVVIFVELVLMAAVCILLPPESGVISWVLVFLLLLAATGVIGWVVSGVWWGVLVDSRNMVSLSRLQLAIWTLLILSAFLTVALTNVSWLLLQKPHALVDPLGIAIPEELWALMGISTASFAGSTLIKSNKATTLTGSNTDTSGQRSLESQRPAPGTTAVQGALVKNTSIVDASAADIFRGEEAGNADKVDLGKVQMFFFTFIVVIAYAFALLSVFQGGLGRVTEFPDLSPSMITLLGISHAGYLTVKGAPHTGTTPTQP